MSKQHQKNIDDSLEEEKFVLTPWGCLLSVLSDYGIDCSRLTPTMGKHMVDDFMDAMVTAGHVRKAEDAEVKG